MLVINGGTSMSYMQFQKLVIIRKFVQFHIKLLSCAFCFMWLKLSWTLCPSYFGFLPHFGRTQHEYCLLPNSTSS